MQKKRKTQPRIAATAAQRVARRDTLKGGLSALALAAVGCSSEPNGTASPGQSSPAGSAAPSGGTPATNVVAGAPASSSAAAGTPASTKPAPSTTAAGMSAPAPSAGSTAQASSAGSPATSPTTTAGSASVQGGAPSTPMVAGAGGAAASGMHTDLSSLACIVTPAMTDGPFFVDEKLNRANLLMGETNEAIVKAVPLHLVMGIYEVDGMMCKPLSGVQVDIWQADAIGIYSDVTPGPVQAEDTRGKKSLRGYQMTDESGVVTFETIYPGWYMSRTIHIHFKLRMLHTSGSTMEFTSQMFFDEAINAMVLAKPAYTNRTGKRSVLNDDDHIFNGTAQNNQKPPAGMMAPGKSIMPTVVAMGDSYTATLKIGVKA